MAGLPPEDAVEVRALLVRAAGLDGVALAALRLENFGALRTHRGLRKTGGDARRRGGGVDVCRCCGAFAAKKTSRSCMGLSDVRS